MVDMEVVGSEGEVDYWEMRWVIAAIIGGIISISGISGIISTSAFLAFLAWRQWNVWGNRPLLLEFLNKS